MVKNDVRLKSLPQCMQLKSTYTLTDYPSLLELEQLQLENFWLPDEVRVENDTHQLRTGLEPSELHGVLTTLKLFVLYELRVGQDFWLGKYMRSFPRPEMQRVASVNGMVELNIHAPMYNKINEILRLNTDKYYESYTQDPILNDRMSYIDDVISSKDTLLSLATFSMIEGAILYSSFAYLKHFQVNGKNKLGAIVSGMDFSVRDENIHSLGGAATFVIAVNECLEAEILTKDEVQSLYMDIVKAAEKLKEHEFRIVEMIFEKGKIDGINEKDMKTFVKSRINLCLNNLGISSIYDIKDNPIAKWFYDNINMPTIHDFFVNLGSQYNRNYSEAAFVVEGEKYNFRG